MSAQIIDGKAIAADVRNKVRLDVEQRIKKNQRAPGLAVILVGLNPASQVYVRKKREACNEAGLISRSYDLDANTTQQTLLNLIEELNSDATIDGILVQLPLPRAIDSAAILDRVDPTKDVDGFHPQNVGLLQKGRPRFVPCTPAGIMEMLGREGIDIKGRRAVVVGRSEIVGKPMAMLLLHAHATVTICHSRTRELAEVTREAEILIAAAGVLSLIGPDHVSDGAVVVDVGMHRVSDHETVARLYPGNQKKLSVFAKRGAVLAGDVDYTAVAPKAGRITPVPGGVGPLTIAMLMANTAKAAKLRRGI